MSPPPHTETDRDRLAVLLVERPLTVRELSQAARIAERDVLGHLEHLARSAAGRGQRLSIEPSRCLGCDFVFQERTRFTKPGKCPECRSTRITPARFALERA